MPWVVNWTIKERSAGIAHPTFTPTAGYIGGYRGLGRNESGSSLGFDMNFY